MLIHHPSKYPVKTIIILKSFYDTLNIFPPYIRKYNTEVHIISSPTFSYIIYVFLPELLHTRDFWIQTSLVIRFGMLHIALVYLHLIFSLRYWGNLFKLVKYSIWYCYKIWVLCVIPLLRCFNFLFCLQLTWNYYVSS